MKAEKKLPVRSTARKSVRDTIKNNIKTKISKKDKGCVTKYSLLLTESDKGMRDFLQAKISKSNLAQFNIKTLNSLKETLQLLELKSLDILLINLNLLDSNGLNTLKRVHKDYPDIAKVVYADEINEETVDRTLREGAQFYFISGKIEKNLLIQILCDAAKHKQIEKSIESASRLITVGEMAGYISHDINNPLTIIQHRAEEIGEMAEAGALKPLDLIDWAKQIEQSTERIVKICHGVLTLVRRNDTEPMVSEDVKSIIEESVGYCSEKFKRGGRQVIIEKIPEARFVICRRGQLVQVFVNLLNNAYDAVDESDKKWVKIGARSQHNKLIVRVTDSGHGIPAGLREKIMHPFFTSKSLGKGTGLGLTISKRIIEKCGGDLRLDTTSSYTRFVIELPCYRQHRVRATQNILSLGRLL